MTLVVAALAAVQVTAAVQANPPAAASPAPPVRAATARISGTVKNAADDTPLARARVVAVSPGLAAPRAVITGSDGRYAIGDLPDGSYTITATRTGFAPFTFGQGQSVTGTPVAVAGGQHVGSVDLPLVAAGVIVGRILDEDGTPFAGATVDALMSRFQNGTDTLFSVATVQTDDRGEFRLFGLAPGSYYVSAADPAFAQVASAKGVLRYSPTYYPGTALPDQARTIAVGAGTPPRVEFKLQIVPPARVSGRLVAYDSRQLISGAIVMSPLEGRGVPIAAPEEPAIYPDGRFSFNAVAPGRYQIRARGQTEPAAATLFAVYSIEVFGADADGVTMTLRPGATVDGRLTVESVRGTRPPDLSTLRVRAPFIDGNAFGDSLTGSVQPNGRYTLRGLMQGAHQILVDGLEPPWVVKSVTYHGSDITDLQLPMEEREELHDVRIVISDASTVVSGVVQDSRKLPVANTGVLVCATVPLYWRRTSRRMRIAFTDQQGRWSVTGLPPGEYVAVAGRTIDEGDLGRSDRLETLLPLGTPFRLDSADARATLTLQVSPPVPAATVR